MTDINADNKISVINPLPDSSQREMRGGISNHDVRIVEISVKDLSNNISYFQKEISTIFENLEESKGIFKLQKIEVSISISTVGKISILNIGGEIGSEGCFKLTFKK